MRLALPTHKIAPLFVIISIAASCKTARNLTKNEEALLIETSEHLEPNAAIEQLIAKVKSNKKIDDLDERFKSNARKGLDIYVRYAKHVKDKNNNSVDESLIETEFSRYEEETNSILKEYQQIDENLPAIRLLNYWAPSGLVPGNVRPAFEDTKSLVEIVFPTKFSKCTNSSQRGENKNCDRTVIDRCGLLFSSEKEKSSALIITSNYETKFVSEKIEDSFPQILPKHSPPSIHPGLKLFIRYYTSSCKKAAETGVKFRNRSAFFQCEKGGISNCRKIEYLSDVDTKSFTLKDFSDLCLNWFSDKDVSLIKDLDAALPNTWKQFEVINSAFNKCAEFSKENCKNVTYIGEIPAYSYVAKSCKVVTATKKDIDHVARAIEIDSNADADAHRLMNLDIDTCDAAWKKGFRWNYVKPKVDSSCIKRKKSSNSN